MRMATCTVVACSQTARSEQPRDKAHCSVRRTAGRPTDSDHPALVPSSPFPCNHAERPFLNSQPRGTQSKSPPVVSPSTRPVDFNISMMGLRAVHVPHDLREPVLHL